MILQEGEQPAVTKDSAKTKAENKPSLICDEMSEEIVRVAEQIVIHTGAENITVRRILQTMGITNRVFYNRFRNIGEVLDIVYESMILKIRDSITAKFNPEGDFFEEIIGIVANTLLMSYEVKMNFSHYIFENDSLSHRNYDWWKAEITKLIEFGKANGHLRDVDTDVMSYAIWCFIRGYNADALARGIPRDRAVEDFKYSFRVLLEGMKA